MKDKIKNSIGDTLYAIQISPPEAKGEWIYAGKYYGLDMATGNVGGYWMGSIEHANMRVKELRKNHLTCPIRIVVSEIVDTIDVDWVEQ